VFLELSIIIVNYNGLSFLKKCLKSIYRACSGSGEKHKVCYEVIIVDNGSSDGSIEFIEDEINRIKSDVNAGTLRFIECGENTGFSRASNLGAVSSGGKFLLFLNPDTELTSGGFYNILDFLKNKSGREKVGVIGARTVNPDGSLQYSCRSFPTLARQFYESFFLNRIFKKNRILGSSFMTYWDHKSVKNVDWLSGSFMLIEKSAFENAGRFDENYFMYSEDTDLCLRLRQKDLLNYYYSKYTVIHDDAGIASKNMALRESQIWKSRRYYFRKNYSKLHSVIFSLLYFKYIINRIIVFSILVLFKKSSKYYSSRLMDFTGALKLYFSGI
jgi:GT2 family glycosyltransferase